MPYTPEFRCAECDQPLEAQITIDGRLLIQLCPTCKVRLLLNLPDREPEPETMEVRE
jgi:DNA-directed RNA polymerase subunit RPC12/RpoP